MVYSPPSSVVLEDTRSSLIIPQVPSLRFRISEVSQPVSTNLASCSFQEEQPRCLLHYRDI